MHSVARGAGADEPAFTQDLEWFEGSFCSREPGLRRIACLSRSGAAAPGAAREFWLFQERATTVSTVTVDGHSDAIGFARCAAVVDSRTFLSQGMWG